MKLTPNQIKKFLSDKYILSCLKEVPKMWNNLNTNIPMEDKSGNITKEYKEEIEAITLYENEIIEDIGELLHLDIDDISNIKYCDRDFLVWVAECKKHLKENTPFIF